MGELYDAPNQQVVRPDGSGPADEGTGGSTHDDEQAQRQAQAEPQEAERQSEPEAQPAPVKAASTRRKTTSDPETPTT